MFNKTLKWNTGRRYSADGQIMEAVFQAYDGGAELNTTNAVVGSLDFADHTRGIQGRYENVTISRHELDYFFKDTVMKLYDDGGYSSSEVFDSFGNPRVVPGARLT